MLILAVAVVLELDADDTRVACLDRQSGGSQRDS